MHEMALCQSMLDLIEQQRIAQNFARVQRVIVEVGVLGHVDPHALEFAFDVSARATSAENAELEIREIAGEAWCMNCSDLVSINTRGESCPTCGGYQLIVRQGEELRLKELEVV